MQHPKQVVWRHTWRHTLEKSHTNATSVTMHHLGQVIWGQQVATVEVEVYHVWWEFDTYTLPPLSLLTFPHHGGILSWWEYAKHVLKLLLHHHHYVSAAHFLLPGCCHRSLHGGNKGFSPILLFSVKPAIFTRATIFTHPTVFTILAIFTQPNIFTHFFFQSFNFRIIFMFSYLKCHP